MSQELKTDDFRVQLVVFNLGEGEYALQIDQIKEVVMSQGIAKIPQTPSYVAGVSNIRGSVITIIDLVDKFSLSNDIGDTKNKPYTLVVESDGFQAGILLEKVPNTLSIMNSNIDKTSTALQYSSLREDCVNGIVNLDGRMIIMVDLVNLMAKDEYMVGLAE